MFGCFLRIEPSGVAAALIHIRYIPCVQLQEQKISVFFGQYCENEKTYSIPPPNKTKPHTLYCHLVSLYLKVRRVDFKCADFGFKSLRLLYTSNQPKEIWLLLPPSVPVFESHS